MNDHGPRPGFPRALLPWRRLFLAACLVLAGILLGALIFRSGGPGKGGTNRESESEVAGASLWTCSMHPQIKLPEPGKCPICFMDLIPVEGGAADESPVQLAMSEAAMKLAEIVTVAATRAPAEGEIRTIGKVTIDERRLKRITAWTGGRLDRLFVDFTGESVRSGDPLVELYSPQLYSAQIELIQALKAQGQLEGGTSTVLGRTATSTVEAARRKLALLGLTDSQIEQVVEQGTAQERVTIHAPISGIVMHKNAVQGEYVQTGTPIYTIAELSRVWILLDAYESDLVWVQVGQRVTFEAEAFPGRSFEGRVAFIDPVLDPKTRTVKVRVEAENTGLLLKPEMFVRAVIHGTPPAVREAAGEPLVIPASAPLLTGKRAVVYVRVPGRERPTFEGREVILGPRAGEFYIVKSGLAEGEEVVARGAFKIDSEMQIQAKPSMMSPDGGGLAHHHAEEGVGGTVTIRPETGGTARNATGGVSRAGLEAMGRAAEASSDLSGAHASFTGSLGPLFDAYLALQRALAGDDIEGALKGLHLLERAVAKADADGLEAVRKEAWRNLAEQLRGSSERAREAADLDAIRRAFEPITAVVVALEEASGPPAGPAHRLAYCPMAFDNRGAYWIQTEDEISNPYFGAMMLRCGEFRDEYAAR